jgi:hypothetical protein
MDLVETVGFEDFTVTNVKVAAFWVHQGALVLETACISETLVNFYHNAPRYDPEDKPSLSCGYR